MVNRIVTESPHGNVNKLIIQFIATKDCPTAGEIWQFITEQGIKITKRGFYMRLDDLIKKGSLKKGKASDADYPQRDRKSVV